MTHVQNGTKIIRTIDTHTGGDPTRIVISGLPDIPGETMIDKKLYITNELDYIRQSILLEPRGHKDMFGALLLEPTKEEADVGVIFLSNEGYLNMCGHGTIGVVTALIEAGMIDYEENRPIVLETPAGLVYATPTLKGNRVTNVSIENVPSFLWKKNAEIYVDGLGEIEVDVAFGGSFFVLVDNKKAGIGATTKENHEYLADIGVKIIDAANENIKVQHPIEEKMNEIDLILMIEESESEDIHTRNINVFGKGQVARSACGTGLCAQMATQVGKGLLKKGENYNTESILKTPFFGTVKDTTKIGDLNAIIPQVSGGAFITGKHEFILHPQDDLKYGFLLG